MIDNLPLVIVTWNDANFDHETPISMDTVIDHHKPTVVTTIGWVLRNDEVGITLVNEFYNDNYRGRTFILAPMIISVEPFKLTKPRRPKPQTQEPPP